MLLKCKTIYFTKCSLFIVCWILGLFFGLLLAIRSPINLLPTIRSTIAYPAHLVASILFSLFPFIITYTISKFFPSVVFYIFFFRAIFFGALLGFTSFAFGSADWLARWLFLFTDSACAVLYIMFFIKEDLCYYRLLRYIAGIVLITVFDHFVIESFTSAIAFLW